MSYLIDTREVVQKFVPKYCKGKVLDIGGGTAKYRSIIESHAEQYFTADINPLDKPDYVEDARRMSFTNESFDTILSFQLLEHVDDTSAVVLEMFRVLRPGSFVIASAPFMGARHGHPSDFYRFTPEGIRWYFEKSGFSIVETGTQGSTLSVCAELLRFTFLNPYRTHSTLRGKLIGRICGFLKSLDRRGILYNPNVFTNVYLIAKKL